MVVVAVARVAGRRTTRKGKDAFPHGPAGGLIGKATLAGPALDQGYFLGAIGKRKSSNLLQVGIHLLARLITMHNSPITLRQQQL
ncbi:hypothetical protein WN48_03965 [Eufriesea mexicana]|nr:hypothetical protein WN48_03965 [Eufriesea mexicana]